MRTECSIGMKHDNFVSFHYKEKQNKKTKHNFDLRPVQPGFAMPPHILAISWHISHTLQAGMITSYREQLVEVVGIMMLSLIRFIILYSNLGKFPFKCVTFLCFPNTFVHSIIHNWLWPWYLCFITLIKLLYPGCSEIIISYLTLLCVRAGGTTIIKQTSVKFKVKSIWGGQNHWRRGVFMWEVESFCDEISRIVRLFFLFFSFFFSFFSFFLSHFILMKVCRKINTYFLIK